MKEKEIKYLINHFLQHGLKIPFDNIKIYQENEIWNMVTEEIYKIVKKHENYLQNNKETTDENN